MANLEDLFSGFNSRKSSEDAVRYGEELDATAPIRPASKSSTTIPRAESMAPYAIRAEETPRPDTSFESRLLRALQWIADNREILAETADGLTVSEDSFTKWGRTYRMLYLRHPRWTDRAGRARPFKFGESKALALLSVLSEIVQFVRKDAK